MEEDRLQALDRDLRLDDPDGHAELLQHAGLLPGLAGLHRVELHADDLRDELVLRRIVGGVGGLAVELDGDLREVGHHRRAGDLRPDQLALAGEQLRAGLVDDRGAVERQVSRALDHLEHGVLFIDLVRLARGARFKLIHRLVDGRRDVGAVDRKLGAAEVDGLDHAAQIGQEVGEHVFAVAVGHRGLGRLLLGLIGARREEVKLKADALGQTGPEGAAPCLVPFGLVERGDGLLLRHAADVDAAEGDVRQVGAAVRDEIGAHARGDDEDQRQGDKDDQPDQSRPGGLAALALFPLCGLLLRLRSLRRRGTPVRSVLRCGGAGLFRPLAGVLRRRLFLFGLRLVGALLRLFRAALLFRGRVGRRLLFLRRAIRFRSVGLFGRGGGRFRRFRCGILRQAGEKLLIEPCRIISLFVAHACSSPSPVLC